MREVRVGGCEQVRRLGWEVGRGEGGEGWEVGGEGG